MQVRDAASGFGFLAIKILNMLGLQPENALLRTRFFVTFLAMKKVRKTAIVSGIKIPHSFAIFFLKG